MIGNLPSQERKDDADFYDKMLARVYIRRGSAHGWLSQFDSAISDLREAMTYKGIFSDLERNKMEADIAAFSTRKDSQAIKLEGDIFFARNMLNESLEQYTKAVECDPKNEYALLNIGVIYLKRQDFDKCLEFTNASLALIEEFHADTREFQRDNVLEVKLLQRRAKCYEVKDMLQEARDDLDRAMMLDKENPAVKAAYQKVQTRLNAI